MDLKELQSKYEDLGREIEALKNKPTNKRWRAGAQGNYFYLDVNGIIREGFENRDLGDLYDNYRYVVGNYFKSKEEAEHYKQKLLAEQELKDLANGYKYVLGNQNYTIYFDYRFHVKKYMVNICSMTISPFNVYFKSKEEAQNAIDTLGEEKLKLIFGVCTE